MITDVDHNPGNNDDQAAAPSPLTGLARDFILAVQPAGWEDCDVGVCVGIRMDLTQARVINQ
jgi:hypothetical protein